MIVMPSNNTGFHCGVLFGRYPGRLAHLMNPQGMRTPHPEFEWVMDNGVFGAWSSGRVWSASPFYEALEKYRGSEPMWIVVPDWVGDRESTLFLWAEHSRAVSQFGKLAMAVQDGMTPEDVPEDAEVVFVGGSTQWKWANLKMWTSNFPRVHVGRVNTYRMLVEAHEAGAESCDGTGWFRGDKKQLAGLVRYLEETKDPPFAI